MVVSSGILGIQIAGVCFALFMLYLTFLKYKRNELTNKSFIIFVGVWCGFLFMCFFPGSLDSLIDMMQFHRRWDFFIILGFMFVIALAFYSHLTLIKINKRTEDVVREVAYIKLACDHANEAKCEKCGMYILSGDTCVLQSGLCESCFEEKEKQRGVE